MDTATAKQAARSGLNRVLRAAGSTIGYDVVRHHFYNPLPDVENLRPSLWPGRQPTPGLDLRMNEAVTLLSDLQPYFDEWQPPIADPGVPGTYFTSTMSFGTVDAEILYSLIRHRKPANVLEFGSGASSHVIHAARRANADDGVQTQHTIFDPFPFQANAMGPVEATRVHPSFAQDVNERELAVLKAGDILFVDTTHTVKTGGDANRIILELLPLIAPGVLVHVHDVFLPYEYPKHWVVDNRFAWAEQYLLQAFLAFNTDFRTTFPAFAVAREHADTLAAAIASFQPGDSPSSFWFERVS